jgi:hypothetical protein
MDRSRSVRWAYARIMCRLFLIFDGARADVSLGHSCSGSGLGYDAGDNLGSIIPRFSGASVFHLISE